MRISIRSLTIGAGAALLLAACRGRESTAATDPDLQRDLAAASSDRIDLATPNPTGTATVSALEAPPPAEPTPAPRPRRNNGPKVTRSEAPTQEAVQTTEVAEAPEPTPEPSPVVEEAPTQQGVALPRPVPQEPASTGRGDQGTWGSGGGIGQVIGVVIRGGGVGDDHCDPRTDGRGRGQPGGYYPPPIYRPIPDGQGSTRTGGIMGGPRSAPAPRGGGILGRAPSGGSSSGGSTHRGGILGRRG